jgi:hypothetical protein
LPHLYEFDNAQNVDNDQLMILGCATVIFYGKLIPMNVYLYQRSLLTCFPTGVNIKTIAYPSHPGTPTHKYYNFGTLQKVSISLVA